MKIFLLLALFSLLIVAAEVDSTTNPASPGLLMIVDPFAEGDININSQLLRSDVEIVFGVNPGYKPIKLPGIKTAMRLCPHEITTAKFLSLLKDYDYVHVSELSPIVPCDEDCIKAIKNVSLAGFGGRMIFFIRYSFNGDHYDQLIPLFDAAKQGLVRKIFFDIYGDNFLYTSNMNDASNYLSDWNKNFNKIYPSSGEFLAPAVGLTNGNSMNPYLNVPEWDLTYLQSIFTTVQAINPAWRGIAYAYACEAMDTVYYTVDELAEQCTYLSQ